jgi:hypothetical protein
MNWRKRICSDRETRIRYSGNVEELMEGKDRSLKDGIAEKKLLHHLF